MCGVAWHGVVWYGNKCEYSYTEHIMAGYILFIWFHRAFLLQRPVVSKAASLLSLQWKC